MEGVCAVVVLALDLAARLVPHHVQLRTRQVVLTAPNRHRAPHGEGHRAALGRLRQVEVAAVRRRAALPGGRRPVRPVRREHEAAASGRARNERSAWLSEPASHDCRHFGCDWRRCVAQREWYEGVVHTLGA
eukprot:1691962-Prymnesium_polylepis.1